ncbi:MAG: FkbM family methyltransferase [Candidatus Parcubacteria bacterium]|nr:FkbM family methyltransferase [Burkholderiales bacterium]
MTTKRRMLDALNRALAPTGFSLHRWSNSRTVVDAAHPMTRALCASGCFAREPVSVVDAGCSGGLDERWRALGTQLRAWGIDVMTAECARLAAAERNAAVRYVNARLEVTGVEPATPQRNPWNRLSTAQAVAIRGSRNPGTNEEIRSNQWQDQVLSEKVLTVDALMETQGVDGMDFLKIDLDGPDYEVLTGFVPHLDRLQTLGVKAEVNFFGPAQPDVHSFHNTDRLLRAHGFELFGLSTRSYSSAALPAAFATGVLGPTTFGRILQGDALYFRDPAGDAGQTALSPTRLLKLACMFELFDLPDCAAELLLRFGDAIGRNDTAQLLDLLVPRLDGTKLGYGEYLARFRADPRSFT